MKPTVQLRAMVTETQAARLRQRIAALPFKVTYEEEQRGATLMARIACTAAQERAIREMLHELGAAITEASA
jgi:hypothetical protein